MDLFVKVWLNIAGTFAIAYVIAACESLFKEFVLKPIRVRNGKRR